MYRSSIPDWLQTFLSLVGIVFVCWFLLRIGVSETPVPGTNPVVEARKLSACKSAVEQCVARADLKLEAAAGEQCNPEKAKQRLEAMLSDPVASEGCREAPARLAAGCPQGCELENIAPLVVPGKLKVQSDAVPNEAGLCSAFAELTVIMRGSCIKTPRS